MKTSRSNAAKEREERAAAAMRENLKRRKQQQQARAGHDGNEVKRAETNKED